MPVLFCGENPGFTLYAKDGTTVAVVSYWVSRDSVFGRGHALVVHSTTFQAVLTDNFAMAQSLNERFTKHFPEFSHCGVPERILEAYLSETWQGDSLRVRATTAHHTVEAHWSEALDKRIVVWKDFPGTNCDLSNVLVPCANAALHIDGVNIPGDIKVEGKRSSAFLALCEVWLERQE
jgi:hypothetical protein